MIIHGDCLEELKKLPENSVDLIVTDPPYNIGYKYASYKDTLSEQEYFDWQIEVLRECERILTENGSLFYLNYPEFNSKVFVALSEDFEMKPVEIIAWVYNTHNSGKPLRKSFRTWIWASKGNPKNKFTGEYKNPDDKRVKLLIEKGAKPTEYDWWHMEQVKNISSEKTEHPCQLPVAMIRKIILACSEEGDVVLDPFLGSGTVAVAAHELKREFIGIEIERSYICISEERLAIIDNQPALF